MAVNVPFLVREVRVAVNVPHCIFELLKLPFVGLSGAFWIAQMMPEIELSDPMQA